MVPEHTILRSYRIGQPSRADHLAENRTGSLLPEGNLHPNRDPAKGGPVVFRVAEMNELSTITELTMSTYEIAELTEKQHRNVLADCRKMLVELHGEGGVLKFQHTHINPQNGQAYPIFRLPKRETLILVSGYSLTMRARIIDRWQELEEAIRRPKELSRLELLQMALEAEQQRLALEQKVQEVEHERDEAIRTKAWISSRREAVAMATASREARRAEKLEVELDQSKQYVTIKRMSMLYHGQKFDWRLLKSTSAEMGLPPDDVFDANYGTVKAYHVDVWREAYALELPDAA